MEKEIIYSGIERITYKFTENEIRDALMEMNMIKKNNVREIIFDMYDDDGGNKGYAELTLVFETILKPKKEKKNDKKDINKQCLTTGSNYFHG